MAARQEHGRVPDWLKANRDAVERALASVDLGGERVHDAVLARPETLVDLVGAMAREARDAGAPDEVSVEIEAQHSRMADGLSGLDELQFARQKLAELKGIKSEKKFLAALDHAANEAPTDADRAKLAAMATAAREHPEVTTAPVEGLMSRCAGCCGFTCIMCAIEFPPVGPVGCLACCAVGCLLC